MISGGGGGITLPPSAGNRKSGDCAVRELVRLVRAKNAGPFRLTIDCFCDSRASYERLRDGLSADAVAARLGVPADGVSRYAIDALRVVKFSLPRPLVQGAAADRDLHGAQWAMCVAEIAVG